MLTRRYGVALGIAIALIALVPMTARPARDELRREVVADRPGPDTWPEIKALDRWNPVPWVVTLPDGTHWLRSWRDTFGWFCYTTFVDPGLAGEPWGAPIYVRPPSEDIHAYFKALTATCTGDPAFGGALKLLFENVDAFTRDLPSLASNGRAQTGPLSKDDRERLREVAKAMRRVMASRETQPEIKATAHLIAALTEDREVTRDAVSTRELARIPDLYPQQPLIGLVSLYYLEWVLAARREGVEARRVADLALHKYGDYPQIRHLKAYRNLQLRVARTQGTHNLIIEEPF